MYLWEAHITEQGYIKGIYKEEIGQEYMDKFIERHQDTYTVFYDYMGGVAGWESSYTKPYYIVKFLCDDTDVDIIFWAAKELWYDADRYSMELEAMRKYLHDVPTNINAARFLKGAASRWNWLTDREYLEDDLVGWEGIVNKAIDDYKNKRRYI